MDPDLLDPSFDLAQGEEERRTVLERLRRQQESRQAGFDEKMKLWESSRNREEEYDEQLKVTRGSQRAALPVATSLVGGVCVLRGSFISPWIS